MVECQPTRFTYPEGEPYVDVPFDVSWDTGKIIDNPNKIHGECPGGGRGGGGGSHSIVVAHWTAGQQVERLILYLGCAAY